MTGLQVWLHPSSRTKLLSSAFGQWSLAKDQRRLSHSPSFRRPAAVVRNRRRIADRSHFNPGGSQSAHGGLAAGTRAADADIDAAHAVIACHVRGVHRRLLRGKRRPFARSPEPEGSRTLPRQNVAVHVGYRHDRVIEGRLHIRQPMRYVLALLLLERLLFAFFLRCGCCAARCCWFCHRTSGFEGFKVSKISRFLFATLKPCHFETYSYVFAVAFFFCATVPLRGPFRVRAFVCVRCPRTGRLRRCRNPR